ncbi:MAG: phage shock protein operon transcriptional activator [Deltaproteobacteria bacterium]|nr:phage shock protein operon transcriptional activator [Deltaproteobacteria bacterium]
MPALASQEGLGESESFLDFQERLSRAARVDRPILIIGERGTGKELAASRLHYLSHRWRSPLLALNCAALSPGLIESELFGYEPGAFTGAVKRRIGRFEAAHGGTLFLDEIGNIPLEAQEKILRVVEYGTFERVGGSDVVMVDVRIIGATNADLPALAREGRFKRDLLDRLSFEVLLLPALRNRAGDVSLLARHFASRIAKELGHDALPVFTREAMISLEAYSWPGNVRELKNVVERAVYRSDSESIKEIVFDPFPESVLAPPSEQSQTADSAVQSPLEPALALDTPLTRQVADLEIRLIQRALLEARFRQHKAAELLGLTYHQFRGLYRKHASSLNLEP